MEKDVIVLIQDAITLKAVGVLEMERAELDDARKEGVIALSVPDLGKLSIRESLESSDGKSVLVKVVPSGIGKTLYMEDDDPGKEDATGFLSYLESVIRDRKEHPQEGSYTNKLFSRGINRIAQKVGEEATEVVIEAKDDNPELFLGEAADLMYHYLVLLVEKGFSLDDVSTVLKRRHKR